MQKACPPPLPSQRALSRPILASTPPTRSSLRPRARLRFPAPWHALLALLAVGLPSAQAGTLVFQGGNWDDASVNWRDSSNNLVPYFNSTDTTSVLNGPISVFVSLPRTTGSMTLNNGVALSGDYLLIKGGAEINGAGAAASTFNNRVLVFPGPSTLTLKGQLAFNNTIEAGAGQLVAVAQGTTTLGPGAVLMAAVLQVGSASGPFVTLNGGAGTLIATTGDMVVGQTPGTTGIVNTTGTTFNIGGDLLLAHDGNCNVTVNGGSINLGGALRIADTASTTPLPSAVMTLRNTTLTVADSGGAGIRGAFFTGGGDIGVLPTLQLPGTRVQVRPGGFLTIDSRIGMGVNNTIFDTTNGDIRIDGRLWGKTLIKEGPGILKLTRDNYYGGGGGGTLDGTIVRGGFIEFSESANLNDGGELNRVANPSQPATGLRNIQLNGGGLRWAAGSSVDISARLRLLNNFSFDTNGNNVTFASALAGTGGMTKAGAGILTLASGNTYAGGTTVKGGFLEFAAPGAFGSGGITLNGGGLRWAVGNSADVSALLQPMGSGGGFFDTNGNNVTLASGAINGVGLLAKTGAGTLTLQGTHPWTGGLFINGGTVALNGTFNGKESLAVGDVGSGALTMNDSTLSTVNHVRIGGRAGVSGTANIGPFAALSAGTYLEVGTFGAGLLNVTDGGQVSSATSVAFGVLPGSVGEGNVSGLGGAVGTLPATLTAGTTMFVGYQSTGILNIGSGGAVNVGGQLRLGELFGSSGAVVLNTGGTLQIGGADGIRSGQGSFAVALAGGTLKVTGSSLTTVVPMALTSQSVIDTGNLNAVFDGLLSGPGGFRKTGAGILYLNAAGTYAGGTQIDGGQVVVPAGNALGTGAISIFGGSLYSSATFSRDVPITVDGASSSLSAAGFMEIGVGGSGSLAVTNGASVSTPSTLAFAVLPGGTQGSASVTGAGSSLTSAGTMYLGYLGSGFLGVGDGGSVTVGGQISLGTGNTGAGTLVLNAGGTLNIGGADGIVKGDGTANVQLAGGTLKVTGSSLTTAVPMGLTNQSVIDTGNLNAVFVGSLSGPGGFRKTGAGILYLNAVGTYAGGTQIDGGQVVVSAGNALGTGAISISGGSLYSSDTFSRDVPITVDGASSSLSAAGYMEIGVGGSGSLAVTNGASVFTPSTLAFAVLPGGTQGSASVTGAGSSLTSGGTMYLGDLGNGFLGVGDGGSVTVGGQISLGTGNTGVGTLVLNAGGTLQIGGVDGIVKGDGTASVQLAGGTLKVTGADLTSSVPMMLTGLSSVDTNGFAATISGALSGSGGLAKFGAGTLALGQVNSYDGSTIISAGTLALGVSGALPDGSSVVLAGGTLATNGFSEAAGPLALNASSAIDFNPGAVSLAFAQSSGSSWTETLTITGFTIGVDTLRFGTDATGLTAAQLARFRFADYGNATAVIDSQGFVTIPEPGSVVLTLFGVLMLLPRRRCDRSAISDAMNR